MMFGKAAQEQRDRIIEYKRVFGSPEGKRVLFDLMNRFRILEECNDEKQEGMRRVVLYILKQTNINLAEFDRLMKGELE